MTEHRPFGVPRWHAIRALLGLEARALRRNRMACTVLVLAIAAAVSMRLGRDRLAELGRESCYIVYWERDDWVERLVAAAERDNPDRLVIQVVHVAELADDQGTIRYPPGVHSIQLRPAASPDQALDDQQPTWPVSVEVRTDHPGVPDRFGPPGSAAPETAELRDRWTIWFWYSGSNPEALWPYSQWFWRVTAEHFGRSIQFDPRLSPLRPEVAVANRTVRLGLAEASGSEWLEIGLVWMVVLFTASHLAGQSLAEDRTCRTIESVVVTPAGWQAAGLAKRLFYGGLALILGSLVAAVLRPAVLGTAAFWFGLSSATLVALGVGSAAGSRCRSVTAAGAAILVYAALAGALFLLAEQLSGGTRSGLASLLSFERSLLLVWRGAWDAPARVPAAAMTTLVFWACGWQLLGAWSYRRLRSG